MIENVSFCGVEILHALNSQILQNFSLIVENLNQAVL